jgi:large subunit ribosomal protein L18
VKTEVNRKARRERRHQRARRKIVGTLDRPRLCVFTSLKHIYAQIIDDYAQHTLVAAGTLEKQISEQCNGSTANLAAAQAVGKAIGERALARGIERVVFDRGGRKYHGRVRALAESAREAGLEL